MIITYSADEQAIVGLSTFEWRDSKNLQIVSRTTKFARRFTACKKSSLNCHWIRSLLPDREINSITGDTGLLSRELQ
jgi:hypothetical protein